MIDGVEAMIAAMDDDERRAVGAFLDGLIAIYDVNLSP
jgi:hypothetical protein